MTCLDWLNSLKLIDEHRIVVSNFLKDNYLELEDLKEIKTIEDLEDLQIPGYAKETILAAFEGENAVNLDKEEEKNDNNERANNSTQKPMTPTARRKASAAVTTRQENTEGVNYHGTTSPKHNNKNNNNSNSNRNRNEQSVPTQGAKLNMIGLNNVGNTCFMNCAIQV